MVEEVYSLYSEWEAKRETGRDCDPSISSKGIPPVTKPYFLKVASGWGPNLQHMRFSGTKYSTNHGRRTNK
jgi:hypothetical protein